MVTSLWSNWALFEVLEQEIQLQRLLRQQSVFPRPPSTSNTEPKDSCHTTPLASLTSTPCSAGTGPYGQRDADSQVRANIAVDCSSTQLRYDRGPHNAVQNDISTYNKGVQVAEPTVSSPHRRCNRPLLPLLKDIPIPNPTAATKPAPPPPTPNKDVPEGFTMVRRRKKKVRCTSLFASHNVFSVLQCRIAARAQDSPYKRPPAKTRETSSAVTSPRKRNQYLCRPTPSLAVKVSKAAKVRSGVRHF